MKIKYITLSALCSLGISYAFPVYAENTIAYPLPEVEVNTDVIDALKAHEAHKKAFKHLSDATTAGSVIKKDPQVQQHLLRLAEPWVNPDTVPLPPKQTVAKETIATDSKSALTEQEIEVLISKAETYKQHLAQEKKQQLLDKAIAAIDKMVPWSKVEPQRDAVFYTLESGDFIGPRWQKKAPISVAAPWQNPDIALVASVENNTQGWNGLVEQVSPQVPLVLPINPDPAFIAEQQKEIIAMVERSVPTVEGNTIQRVSAWSNPDQQAIKKPATSTVSKAAEPVLSNPAAEESMVHKEVKEEEIAALFIPTPEHKPEFIPVRLEQEPALAQQDNANQVAEIAQAKPETKKETAPQKTISPLAQKIKDTVETQAIISDVSRLLVESVQDVSETLEQAKQENKTESNNKIADMKLEQQVVKEVAVVKPITPQPIKEENIVSKEVKQKTESTASASERVKKAIKEVTIAEQTSDDINQAIAFKPADINLQQDAKAQLQALVESHPNMQGEGNRIRIIGYTPSASKEGYSARRVSLQRAIAIRNFLIKAGIDSKRINVQIMTKDVPQNTQEYVDVVVVR